MIDDGKAYAGRAEIRRRRQEAKSEWAYTSEITEAEPVGATGYHVITHLEGNFPGGTTDLHYQFTLGDGLKPRQVMARMTKRGVHCQPWRGPSPRR
jgi:hypothetical protein